MSAAETFPRRGEVWWVSFGPSQGGEIHKTRPAVVISNDAANAHLNRVQVIPLTGSTERLYPSEAYVTVAGRRSKAMADQMTTASKRRLRDRLGVLSPDDLAAMERAVRIHLDLT